MKDSRHRPDSAVDDALQALGADPRTAAGMPDAEARELALALALMAEPAPPPPALRDRLVRAIASTASARVNSEEVLPGISFVFASSGSWRDTGIPGVQVQVLHIDAARRMARTLVRLAPGARYPAHRHEETEETILLAGDLTVEGRRMAPGDYCIALRGTQHGELRTEDGATFMAHACLDDLPAARREHPAPP